MVQYYNIIYHLFKNILNIYRLKYFKLNSFTSKQIIILTLSKLTNLSKSSHNNKI